MYNYHYYYNYPKVQAYQKTGTTVYSENRSEEKMTRENVAMTKQKPNILFGGRLGLVPEHKGKTVTSNYAHEKHLVCFDVADDCEK